MQDALRREVMLGLWFAFEIDAPRAHSPMRLTSHLPPESASVPALTFYVECLRILDAAGIPFLVGGAFALKHYGKLVRDTKDLDLMTTRVHVDRALVALEAGGCETDLRFPHWLAKAYSPTSSDFIDLIFNSGNGLTPVDDTWFARAETGRLLGRDVRVCPPEETIWSKAFVMERERYDGSDVAHLLCALRHRLDWKHLLARFGDQWAVLLSHLVLFGFIYPAEAAEVPAWVMDDLVARLKSSREHAPRERVCGGTLLSREQYLVDLERGYRDARLAPVGGMSPEQIAAWTAAIHEE